MIDEDGRFCVAQVDFSGLFPMDMQSESEMPSPEHGILKRYLEL